MSKQHLPKQQEDRRHPFVKQYDDALMAFDNAYDENLMDIIVLDHSTEHLDDLAEATKTIASKLIRDMDLLLNAIKKAKKA